MSTEFTVVMDSETARKMSCIGAHYGRSCIKKIEWACKRYIEECKKAVGSRKGQEWLKIGTN